MIADLKFVKGAVAKKDYQPALTHFRIANGRVTGFNGVIALSSPIALDLVACPKAQPFVRAIELCKNDQTVIHLTPAGRLSVKSGKFKAFVECSEDTDLLDAVQPEGVGCEMPGEILNAFRVLEPFIGEDASRPWSNGIMLMNESAYATNNVIVAQYWVGTGMPTINIPRVAIDELIRIGEEPLAVTLGERSITFHFDNDRWMRSQLLNTDWPKVDTMLEQDGDFAPFPPGLFEEVEKLKPFLGAERVIYFRAGRLTTSPEGESGATIELEGVPPYGAYDYDYLLSLQGVVSVIDFSKHPRACPFRGRKLRGIFLGKRDGTQAVTSV